MSDWRIARGQVAALTRSRTPDDPDLIDARRRLCVARLEEHILAALAQAPPLTDEQRARLAAVVLTARAAGGGAA